MAMTIKHAILHILQNGQEPVYSKEELDIESEACQEFIGKHFRRLMGSAAAKKATFSAESEVFGLVSAYRSGDMFFGEFSTKLCERLWGIMQNADIPSADILVTAVENAGQNYLAVLKLNYVECYTHRIEQDGTQLVKSASMLPFATGKVEEACLIPFDPMVLQILEKPYAVNGEEQNYFSGLFLECACELSKKETVELLLQVTEEVNAKHFADGMESEARLRYAIIEEAEQSEEDAFMLVGAAGRAFAEHPAAKEDFLTLAREAGLPHEVTLPATFARRQFGTQRFKAENGVELKIPAELFEDPDAVRLLSNPDGSVSITLKRLYRA